jgi:diacylglycerol O-acyltransferase
VSEPLSPSDQSALNVERGPVHMHVGGVFVFDGRVEHDTVLGRVIERLHLIPGYRTKLKQGLLGLRNPRWVEDEDFDPERHVRRIEAPSPGDEEALCKVVGDVMSERLDRDMPLWQLFVVEGLSDDRTALVAKMHHALIDGLDAIDVITAVLDPGPDELDVSEPHEEEEEDREESRVERLAQLASAQLGSSREAARDTVDRILRPDRGWLAERVRVAAEKAGELTESRSPAPETRLNVEIGSDRRFALGRGRFGDVDAVRDATDATVNDALLAAVALMLSDYLDDPELDSVVALVPVSTKDDSEDGDSGNRLGLVFVDLPLHGEPLERVREVSKAMDEAKGSAQVKAGALLVGVTGFAPPIVSAPAVEAMGSQRVFNLVVSNIPGPEDTLHLKGVPLREVFPAVPLNPANQALSIGMLSYGRDLYFGLLADREALPDIGEAAAGLERAFESLAEAAGESG